LPNKIILISEAGIEKEKVKAVSLSWNIEIFLTNFFQIKNSIEKLKEFINKK